MTTQEHVPIKDIRDDVAILKDGAMTIVLETSAVNFDLLSEGEQLAIIATFAAMLNSLSFSIQIVIRSKRLDISSYLNNLIKAENGQSNPLLKQMINRYRSFVETIIRENEVLDKQFFIVLSVSGLEIGLERDQEKRFQKAMTLLLPRRDHILRQVSRLGLKATQLETERLIKLYYDIYNEPMVQQINKPEVNSNQVANQPQTSPQPIPPAPAAGTNPQPIPIPQPAVLAQSPPQTGLPLQATTSPQQASPPSYQQPRNPGSNTSPFVVEELPDEYGTA